MEVFDRVRLALGPFECQDYAHRPLVSNRSPRVLIDGRDWAAIDGSGLGSAALRPLPPSVPRGCTAPCAGLRCASRSLPRSHGAAQRFALGSAALRPLRSMGRDWAPLRFARSLLGPAGLHSALPRRFGSLDANAPTLFRTVLRPVARRQVLGRRWEDVHRGPWGAPGGGHERGRGVPAAELVRVRDGVGRRLRRRGRRPARRVRRRRGTAGSVGHVRDGGWGRRTVRGDRHRGGALALRRTGSSGRRAGAVDHGGARHRDHRRPHGGRRAGRAPARRRVPRRRASGRIRGCGAPHRDGGAAPRMARGLERAERVARQGTVVRRPDQRRACRATRAGRGARCAGTERDRPPQPHL
jgi:hypothetical protein